MSHAVAVQDNTAMVPAKTIERFGVDYSAPADGDRLNGIPAAPGAKGSIPVTRYQSTTQHGDIQAYESTAAVYAYNATAFATFTAWSY